ncbi:Late embryoproteinsis abundant protein D-29 [Hibiscus syriacus]|uniref:Late embryoproteinsis abundant protein D-29 n=1 Tax=Hibiscus syriacus TaxID=106335 RepID=A0A6A2Z2J9_HIBSY|nr:late embryogenesis abundant protein D-29-like [Hibiscus syriacus]KAE8685793.1 Late embryoproteinsis abundant protein D-29 [Hibiscus syriacus]
MASKEVPVWFLILSTLLIGTAVVWCTSVGHTPSTDDDAKDYLKMKAKTEEATDEIDRQTQQAKDELKSRTQKATDKASDIGEEAKESTESWTGWVKGKIPEGLGFKQGESAQREEEAKDKAADEAEKRNAQTEEGLSWAAAAKNKAGETMEAAKESIASSYESAKQKSQGMKDSSVDSGGRERDEEL